VSIKIENHYIDRISYFSVEKEIRRLISVTPKEHLVGLDKIVIVDELRDKRVRDGAAMYMKKNGIEPSFIEISLNSIYREVPTCLLYLPIFAKMLLAFVLYHEIGHHYYYNFSHGKKGEKKETFADNYSKQMIKKAFKIWLILLRPFSGLFRYLSKRV
jgi:hypothetical protein